MESEISLPNLSQEKQTINSKEIEEINMVIAMRHENGKLKYLQAPLPAGASNHLYGDDVLAKGLAVY